MSQTISAPVQQCIKNINDKNNPEYNWTYNPTAQTLQHVKSGKCLSGTTNTISTYNCNIPADNQSWSVTNNGIQNLSGITPYGTWLMSAPYENTVSPILLTPINNQGAAIVSGNNIICNGLYLQGSNTTADNTPGSYIVTYNAQNSSNTFQNWKISNNRIINLNNNMCLAQDGFGVVYLQKCTNLPSANSLQWKFNNNNLQRLQIMTIYMCNLVYCNQHWQLISGFMIYMQYLYILYAIKVIPEYWFIGHNLHF